MIWDADGWPVIGSGGGTELAFDDVTLPAGTETTFAVPNSLRSRGWGTLGAPHPELDLVGESSDRLIDLPTGADLGSTDRLGALFHPQTDDHQRFSATVDASQILQARMSCGIAVYADPRHYYSAVVRGSDSGGCELRFRRVVDDLVTERVLPIDADASIHLTIGCTSASYAFTAEVCGETLELGEGSARVLSAEVAEWFVNVDFALLAVSESETAVARFTDVEIVDTEPATQPTQLTF